MPVCHCAVPAPPPVGHAVTGPEEMYAPAVSQVALVVTLLVIGVLGAVLLGVLAGRRGAARDGAATWPLVGAGAVLCAVLLAAAGELTDQVVDRDGIARFDVPVWSWFIGHRSPAETLAADTVSTLVGTGVVAAVGGLVAVVLAVRRRRADAALVAIVTAGAAALVVVIKELVARPRPPVALRLAVETNGSFPSGHALVAAAVLGVLAAVACRRLPRGRTRAAVVVAVVGVVLAVGLSRLYLGVHWDSDVLAGWLVGGLWLSVCLTARELVGLCRRGATVERPEAT